jgi:hypothetical protein
MSAVRQQLLLEVRRGQLAGIPEARRWGFLGDKTATATVMVRGRRVTVPRQSWARALKRRWPLLVNVFLLVLADCPPHAVLDLPRLNPCYAD